MATSVGQINFGVNIDASGIAAELNRALAPALAQAQAKLDTKPLKVKIQIDTTGALRDAQRALRSSDLKVTAKLDIDTAGGILRARRALNGVSDLSIKVKLDISDANIAKLNGLAPSLRALRTATDTDIKVKVKVEMSDADAAKLASIGPALRSLRGLSDKDIKIKIDLQVDEAALARVSAALRELRDRRVNVSVNSSSARSADNDFKGLTGSIGKVGSALGTLTKGGAILAAIAGAAGAAAGAVGGLVGALAGVGPALAGIGATAVVGFQGIGDAFSALGDISANAASDARTQAENVANAQDQLTSATEAAESAQQSLADAQDNAADAAKGVADAYKTAQERLDGYNQSLQESNLDQKEAALNLAEAQQKLAQGKFTDPLDRQRAVLAVQRAELNLQKAQEAGKKLQDEANEAQQKGIDQAPEVLDAKKKQADADKQVVQAQKGVEQANRAVAKASQDLAKAQSGAGTSSEKFSDALAQLSPNAQQFVLAAKDIAPSLEAARKAVQDSLFENLGNQLRETATAVLPALTEGMKGVAGQLNGVAQGFFNFAKSAEGVQTIKDTFAGAEQFIQGARDGAEGFGKALSDVTATALPHLQGIGEAFGSIGTAIAKAFSGAAGSGALDQVFVGFEGTLHGLSDLLGSVISQLLDIGAKVLPSLGPLFTSLGDVIKTIGPSLGDIGKTFADSLNKIMPVLGPFIDALLKGLEPVLPVLADLLISLGNALTPLIAPLSQVLQILGTTLAQVLDALAPAIGPLAQAFADLVNALAPILPLIADLVGDIVGALAPALSTIFNAFAPVIKQLADQLKPVFDAMAPILAQVAQTIANALVGAIQALAPLLPPLIDAWANLVLSIAPLLPQLVDLAVQLLPPTIDVLKLLIPVLTDVINVFTWLVNNVIIPIVQPAIAGMKQSFSDFGDAVHSTVDWLQNTVFPALGRAVDTVKGWFSTAVEAIGNIWDGLREKAVAPVNFVIGTVWNNGLLKAWKTIDNLLGGVLPDAIELPLIPTRATGGPLNYFGSGGSGNGTKDDILFWGSNNEHVITAAEVMAAGGQNIIYAIRDMIARGIPFTWDNGKIITDLGRSNLNAYGAAVKQKGIGNVPPEGLFDQLTGVPKYATGGVIMPWMNQLKAGHDFAKAQNGKAYQWAGPRFVGDSFDCSGFMGSIIAAILGSNPWQRYWSTSTFSGYPSVGAQGLVKNLTEGSGMAVGITDDPGGPGGGHTAGELRGIPELNIPAARVESGGSIGDVHYGRGTDPNSFASLYGLPIGANGFFAPAPGGSSNGPSVQDQSSFITKVIESAIKAATDPVRDLIKTAGFVPPPSIKGLPLAALDGTTHFFAETAGKAVSGLGSLVGGVWQRAKDLGGSVVDAGKSLLGHLNPFDAGGLATGTGFMPKNVIDPERVLSPEQTKLFEALVQALSKIASTGLSSAAQAAQTVTVDLSKASVDALRLTTGVDSRKFDQTAVDTKFQEIVQQIDAGQRDTVQLISDTAAETQRTQTSTAESQQAVADQQTKQLLDIANRLSNDVLGPVLSAAVGAGTDFINSLIDGLGKDVVNAVNGTTKAVNNLGTDLNTQATPGNTQPPAFGQPGSAFDAVDAVSKAVTTVADAASQAFNKVRDEIVSAALKQTKSSAGDSKGLLGKDIDAGYLGNLIVQLTGVEIEVRNLLENTYDQIKQFRGDTFSGFDANGELISDTAALVQRTATSMELAQSEQERIQKALIKAVIKYLIVNILIPIITAILGAMITLATTAIGAAIGSAIPVIGTAIGAAVGAAVGAALTGLAAVFTSLLAVGAGAAIDAFDEGGIAPGLGFMPKNTIAPERVLSPRQTAAFETLVQVLDRGGSGGSRSVNVASMTVNGTGAAEGTADRLLQLLNT